jgi:hypothetical protein
MRIETREPGENTPNPQYPRDKIHDIPDQAHRIRQKGSEYAPEVNLLHPVEIEAADGKAAGTELGLMFEC